MARFLKAVDQSIAVFGESGSGKTVLASSFFGARQEPSFSSDCWDLVADDTSLGNRLLRNYVGMKKYATAPPPTRFAGMTYNFSVKVKGAGTAKAKNLPFDTLRLAWHDYPGEWWEESPSSEEEETDRRVEMFRSLLRSDVALLLVDGQRLLDHLGEEERYLMSLLTNFRQGLLRLKDDLLDGKGPLVEFPRIWIIALSKADLFPDWNVHSFRELVLWKANDHIDQLRATLREFVVTPEALSLGEDFMLLSSAKFELSPDGPAPVKIDVTKRVGVDLILPVASMLPLERLVQWHGKMMIPLKVLNAMADGAEAMAPVLLGKKGFGGVAKVVAVLPKAAKLPKAGPLAGMAAIPAVIAAAKMAEPHLKEINKQAQESHDCLTATLTKFKLDLDRGAADGLPIKGK